MSNTYSKEERLEALKLADEIGPVATAQCLNINLNPLYNWQSKAKNRVSQLNIQPQKQKRNCGNRHFWYKGYYVSK